MNERILITGAEGQLGKALVEKYPEATALNRKQLDIADMNQLQTVDWSRYDSIINAAAYVNADKAETPVGREIAWKANAVGPANLARIALERTVHLVHISSEYVFDGQQQNHTEDEPFTPLNVYGQSKSAGDIAVSLAPDHHILRTSWVVGKGHNFVRTMKLLADVRKDPSVVDDQFGRLTFTSELVEAIDHVIKNKVESGTYNLSNSGEIRSWAQLAAKTFELAGHDSSRVKPVSTDVYSSSISGPFAPRPVHSDMDLSKIQATGFESTDYESLLEEYVHNLHIEQ